MSDINWPARKARARAFVQQDLKPRQHWAELPYNYDREDQMYLGWFDDNAKKSATDKAKEAIAAYSLWFGYSPNVLLVNRDEGEIHLGGITIRVESYIRRNNFWVGWEEGFR